MMEEKFGRRQDETIPPTSMPRLIDMKVDCSGYDRTGKG